mgnify:CR=1 FL=1
MCLAPWVKIPFFLYFLNEEVIVELIRFFDWKKEIGCGFPAVTQRGIVRPASNIDKQWIG